LTYYKLVASFDLGIPVCPDEVQQAIAAFPASPTLTVLQARCEAREGHHETALATLRGATQKGFRQLRRLEGAEDFEELVQLPGFAELVETAEAERERRANGASD